MEVMKKLFEFLTVFCKAVKQFAHCVLKFDDSKGLLYHGMWYSPIDVRLEHVQVTNHMHDVQDATKMSAVVIPLYCVLDADHTEASKYCVVTNWWKVRINNGDYVLPRFEASLRCNYDPMQFESELQPQIEVRDGTEYVQI
jgi:hypothetical protein